MASSPFPLGAEGNRIDNFEGGTKDSESLRPQLWGPRGNKGRLFAAWSTSLKTESAGRRTNANPFGKGSKRKTPGCQHLGTGRLLDWRKNSLFYRKLPDKDSNLGLSG